MFSVRSNSKVVVKFACNRRVPQYSISLITVRKFLLHQTSGTRFWRRLGTPCYTWRQRANCQYDVCKSNGHPRSGAQLPRPRLHSVQILQAWITFRGYCHCIDTNLFSGCDGESWAHLKNSNALVKYHDVTEDSVLLEMILFSLAPGPKLIWDGYESSTNTTRTASKDIMLNTDSSSITHVRSRAAVMSVSLQFECSHPDAGPRNRRDTRVLARLFHFLETCRPIRRKTNSLFSI